MQIHATPAFTRSSSPDNNRRGQTDACVSSDAINIYINKLLHTETCNKKQYKSSLHARHGKQLLAVS